MGKKNTIGGITEEVLQELEKMNLSLLLAKSMQKGYDKIRKFTEEFKKE